MRLAPYPLSLRQLQYVAAVAETRSFHRAAERCLVSQPSLSAQVAEIEDALGVRLFERDRRRVLLTAAGTEISERARRVLAAVDDLLEAGKRHVDPLASLLRIGVIPTIGPYLLPDAVPALRRAFPQLAVAWVEDKTETLVRAMQRGEIDAALLALEADLGDLEHDVLGRDPFVLAVSSGHRLAEAATPVDLETLGGERLLLLDDGHCFREQVLAFCSTAKTEELGYRATSLVTLVQMVSSGAGITLLPQIALAMERRRAELHIRPFAAPEPARTLVLAWRRSSSLANALGQIATVVRDVLTRPRHPPRRRPHARPPRR